MGRILWTKQASTDLFALRQTIRDRLISRIEMLADFPGMGSVMGGPYEGFRQLLVERYRVIYQVEGEEVRIAYIRHGARQLGLRPVRSRE